MNPFTAHLLKVSTSFYNFYKWLLENDKYFKNYTIVFIKINIEDLQHCFYDAFSRKNVGI